MKRSNTRYGFTLIELLVVVLIIGILAAIALPQYQKAVDKSRFAATKAALKGIMAAQQIYFLQHGVYADNLPDLDLPPSSCRLNTLKNQCYYPWGYCYLACTPAGSCGGCRLNLSSDSAAIFMTEKGWKSIYCYASTDSDRAYRLCQAETGKTPPPSTGQYTIFAY